MFWIHLLFAAGFVSSANIPQTPLQCSSPASTKGWSGPGTYRIYTYSRDNVVALNDSQQNPSIAVQAPDKFDYSQYWTFAEVAEGVYIIGNNGQLSGPLLSSIE
ncbi:MAG: hypothetical protein Q9174_005806, partial [Haloplaca sp. 1 TL-2023]